MKQKLKKQLKLKSKILINEYPDFFHDNSLNKAYNFLSYINGFNDYHELEKVLNKNLNDKRLNFLKPFHFVDINYQENRVVNLINTIYSNIHMRLYI